MRIIGIHFGHDAAISVLVDGVLESYVYVERHVRGKHYAGLRNKDVFRALEQAGLTIQDIDYCALTSTQSMPFLTGMLDGFEVEFEPHPNDPVHSPLYQVCRKGGNLPGPKRCRVVTNCFTDDNQRYQREVGGFHFTDQLGYSKEWLEPASLEQGLLKRPVFLDDDIRLGLHFPVTVDFYGRRLPGAIISHHMAHAASCYYRSGFQEAAVITQDGHADGVSYQSGLIGYGEGHRLWCVMPHHLTMGALYEQTSGIVGLGWRGAGKLMGLAPYGKPSFFQPSFVGNIHDYQERFGTTSQIRAWYQHLYQSVADAAGYDVAEIAVPKGYQAGHPDHRFHRDNVLTRTLVDVAASTQKLFEETAVTTARVVARLLSKAGHATDNLCLSGGAALNCPANTLMLEQTSFRNVFVEPSCDDGGLAIGSALYIWHNALGQPLRHEGRAASPYLGKPYGRGDLDQALAAAGGRVIAEECADTATTAAEDLFADRVIGWFEGGSESGPRALGHRSILADPTKAANWGRVNQIKRREHWRPFAPAVLEEHAREWFHGGPHPAPYMLFVSQVRSRRLPAVTHVDNTARIQTVNADAGRYYDLIKAFHNLSGVPVVLNTSFNGPNEPIVETPADAVNFLLGSEIDVVYVDGVRLTRS